MILYLMPVVAPKLLAAYKPAFSFKIACNSEGYSLLGWKGVDSIFFAADFIVSPEGAEF
jgi:hypothetical protein